MNEILKIIEERELYVHLILAKVYLSTKGKTNMSHNGDMYREMKELFGEEFDREMYSTAIQYLRSEDLAKGSDASHLTNYGRSYFEGFVKNYQTLEIEDKELLLKKLPKKVVEFFGFAANIITVKDFLSRLINL